MPASPKYLETSCCIVGGGPAGVMLGYLLARAGVDVVVLEKHKDFFRDFRGDTVHASTLELMYELGIIDDFVKIPHQELTTVGGTLGDFVFQAADYRTVPTHCKFVALMPQWDFLDFLCAQARRHPEFQIRMQHEVTGLISEGERVCGVRVIAPSGALEVRAHLVVGCDGRHSTTRNAAKLPMLELGAPFDVLWFRISRHEDDPEQTLGNVNYGKVLVLINRGTYFQAGFIIRKGSFSAIQREGIEAFRESIRRVVPYLADRVQEIQGWDQVSLLTVQINRLTRWYRPGLLCIGDAAHAMSPAGGVGINVAIQDSVAAANLLSAALRKRCVDERVLARVQSRRELPVRLIQWLQVQAHKGLEKLFRDPGPMQAPRQLKFVMALPIVHRIAARVIAVGFQPEHIPNAPHGRRPGMSLKAKLMVAAASAIGVAAALVVRRARARMQP